MCFYGPRYAWGYIANWAPTVIVFVVMMDAFPLSMSGILISYFSRLPSNIFMNRLV